MNTSTNPATRQLHDNVMQTAEDAVLQDGAVIATSAMAPDSASFPGIRRFVAAHPVRAALVAALVGGLAAALLRSQARKHGPLASKLAPKLRGLRRR